MRRFAVIVFALGPAAAMAETMPQMDFHNPLTLDQAGWMVVILVALYLALSRWGLPEIGAVLENRASVIARDLNAARAAKAASDQAIAALNATMKSARADAQAEIAKAIADARAAAESQAKAESARLDAQLAAAEQQIAAARATALAAIKPVAQDTTKTILTRLTGRTAEDAQVAARVDAAMAAPAA